MPVLGTKLHVPAMRRRLVPRPRLTGRLRGDPASLPRLVLVSAPAGFGKTTLLAQWLASDGQPPRVAWLSLDAEDSDLRRFVTHLIAAIQASPLPASLDPLAESQEGIMGSWRPLLPGCLTSWLATRSGRVRPAWFFRTVLAIRVSCRRGCG
jgi:LuxR family transcriptional regulator, maltose regulon positive regulatory protein